MRPRAITPSSGSRLSAGRLCQLDPESEWSNWLRPRSRRDAILLRTCSSFASLEERSVVVSSLQSYWQPRCTTLCLERLRSSSAKVELAFDDKWIIHEGSNWHKHPASNLELQSFRRSELLMSGLISNIVEILLSHSHNADDNAVLRTANLFISYLLSTMRQIMWFSIYSVW